MAADKNSMGERVELKAEWEKRLLEYGLSPEYLNKFMAYRKVYRKGKNEYVATTLLEILNAVVRT